MTSISSAPATGITARHSPLATALTTVAFWIPAAMLVVAAHVELEPRSTILAAAATLVSIVLCAAAYMRLGARDAGTTHALGAGIAWLVLSIVAELVVATRLGHGWFALLGSPSHPLLRNVYLFAWIFAPALFAPRD